MLPAEAALWGKPTLRLLWHARRAERALVTYRVAGLYTDRAVAEAESEEKRTQPRPPPASERGPILVCLDMSGSMTDEGRALLSRRDGPIGVPDLREYPSFVEFERGSQGGRGEFNMADGTWTLRADAQEMCQAGGTFPSGGLHPADGRAYRTTTFEPTVVVGCVRQKYSNSPGSGKVHSHTAP